MSVQCPFAFICLFICLYLLSHLPLLALLICLYLLCPVVSTCSVHLSRLVLPFVSIFFSICLCFCFHLSLLGCLFVSIFDSIYIYLFFHLCLYLSIHLSLLVFPFVQLFVCLCVQDQAIAFMEHILNTIVTKMIEASGNPSKPNFNHYLFETLTLSIR